MLQLIVKYVQQSDTNRKQTEKQTKTRFQRKRPKKRRRRVRPFRHEFILPYARKRRPEDPRNYAFCGYIFLQFTIVLLPCNI